MFPWKDYKDHSVFKAGVISAIIFNILSFPVTVILNAIVIVTVKVKSRLREHKCNILFTILASTDFVVGILAHPAFILVLTTSFLDKIYWVCLLQVISRPAMSFLFQCFAQPYCTLKRRTLHCHKTSFQASKSRYHFCFFLGVAVDPSYRYPPSYSTIVVSCGK